MGQSDGGQTDEQTDRWMMPLMTMALWLKGQGVNISHKYLLWYQCFSLWKMFGP